MLAYFQTKIKKYTYFIGTYCILLICQFCFTGVTEEVENNHAWLKRQSEPYEELAKKWESTFLLRQNNLQENCKTIRDYINSYPALKKSYGHHLVR